MRNLLANRKDIDPANLAKTCSDMARAIPDCLIENHLALVESLQLPDLEDRHVLAAAIVGHADAIVTMNLKDFPADILEKFNLEAQHPDDFILNQLELHHFVAVAAIKRMRSRLKNPSKTAAELILTLENCQLTQTAAWLRNVETLI